MSIVPLSRVVTFIHAYIEAEYAALHASYVEPDELRYQQLVQEAEAMLDNRPGQPMTLGFGRPPNPDTAWLARMHSAAEQYAPRVLFMVQRLAHPIYGSLWVAVVSASEREGLDEYAERWLIVEIGNALRIVSQQTLDFSQRDRVVWEYLSGADVQPEGDVLDVERVVAPLHPLHRVDWDTNVDGGSR